MSSDAALPARPPAHPLDYLNKHPDYVILLLPTNDLTEATSPICKKEEMTHLARGGPLPPQRVLPDHAMRGNPQLNSPHVPGFVFACTSGRQAFSPCFQLPGRTAQLLILDSFQDGPTSSLSHRVLLFKDGPLEPPRCLVNCTHLSRGTKLYHSRFPSSDMHAFATGS